MMKTEADSVQMRKGKIMFKVPNGQDPYSAIGKYIRDHITAIEDIIAVIKINEVETNQLFMVNINEENYFIWENDWWEGEEDVTLIDFFPVSEAINPSAQADSKELSSTRNALDTISRQAAIDAAIDAADDWEGCTNIGRQKRIENYINKLPPAQPEIIRCKDCKYMTEHYDTDGNVPYWTCSEWDGGTDYDGFCHYAERRTDEPD